MTSKGSGFGQISVFFPGRLSSSLKYDIDTDNFI